MKQEKWRKKVKQKYEERHNGGNLVFLYYFFYL